MDVLRARRFFAVAALAGAIFAGCGDDDDSDGGGSGTQAGGGTQEVEVLLSFPKSIAWAPLLVGEANGYFADENVELSIQETEGSGFVTQQIIAGNADFGWAAGDSVIVAASKAPDLRVVACNTEQNIFRIVTTEDDVQSVADLAGKTLGYTEKGGGEEPLVQSALEDAGIADDVRLLPIGAAGPQSKQAIESGEVAAYASSYPDMASLTADGLQLRDITPEKFSRTPGDCFVMTKDTLEDPEKRELVIAIGRAWAMGAQFTIANPSAALEVSCPEVPEECKNEAFAREYMDQTAELLQPLDENVQPAGLDIEGWRTTADVLLQAGTIENEVDVDQLVNSPEVREVAEAIQDFDADAIKKSAESQ
jgi:NitT/TauT family transport system substrate-binding protein